MTATSGVDILQVFAAFLSRNIGLHFGNERLSELGQRMAALGREQGYRSLNDYLTKLMSAPLSREQSDSLARTLAIGETYFLRDPKSYRVLEERILPGLVAARGSGEKSLTILSAGCSSGEEPYSIAILLSRAIPDLSQWKVNLLATDINPQGLERGRRGIYTKWSFRNAPDWLYDYFTRRDDGRFEICAEIRSMVRFEQLNLVQETVAGRWPGDGIDIIFCRNVLLYFDRTAIAAVMQKFHAALKENGWLFVGPTEVDHHSYRGFSCSHYDGALVLRKTPGEPFSAAPAGRQYRDGAPAGPVAAACRLPAVAPQREIPAAAAPVMQPLSAGEPHPGDAASGKSGGTLETSYGEAVNLYQAALYQEAAELALASPAGDDQGAALALAARSFANLGRFAEARENCEKALGLEQLSAPNHYLLSIILEQQGDLAGAMQSLKRSLFIDHDFLLAYFALGNLCRRCGDLKESERNFSTALRLLERRHPHEVLPEADGMTAGRLAELIRLTAGSLTAGAGG